MSDFFSSLKSDLLDRRYLPVLALLGVALIAALAYAVLGAGSSTSSTPPASSSASSGATRVTGAIAISQAPAPNQAVVETTSGSHQHTSTPHNPFTPLPGAKKAASSSANSATSKGSSSSGASSSGSGKSTPSAGGTPPATTLKPIAPSKRVVIHFHATAQFGVVPTSAEGASPQQPAQLQTYKDMAIDEPLPGKDNPQLVYLGVVLKTGKDAVFGLTGEAILHGSATCKPSPTQCQGIELGIGQTEKLEVLGPTGQPVTYELKLLSITKSVSSTASTARAHAASSAKSKAGRALLRHTGLSALSRRGYSTEKGFVRSGK